MKTNLLHHQKTDHWHAALKPSGVMTSDVSEPMRMFASSTHATHRVWFQTTCKNPLRLLRMSRSPLNMWSPKSGVVTSAQSTRC